MGTRGDGAHESLAARLDDVRGALDHPVPAGVAQLAIDANDGTVLGISPAARRLLGLAPAVVEDLVDAGVVARPDLALLRDRVLAALRLPPIGEAAEGWSTLLRIHPVGGRSHEVEVHAIHHRRPNMGAEVVWITVIDHVVPARPSPEPDAAPRRFVSIMDREARVVGISPDAWGVWADPSAMVGMLTTVLVHPEDLARIVASAHAIYSGSVDHTEYTIRVAGSDGRWIPLALRLHRVVTADGHLVVAENLLVDGDRHLIPDGVLSKREVAIVRALFDGLRPIQIAEREGVALKTVRNQLAAAYRKLEVKGQGELLATYHRPVG
ncbi:MAG: LuxR C-terminal-related transcriptional regulator [Acidimicrobiales bacterium]